MLAMAYRSSVQDTIGVTPNLCMLGREVNLPVDLVLPKYEELPKSMPEYCKKLKQNLSTVHDAVRQHSLSGK